MRRRFGFRNIMLASFAVVAAVGLAFAADGPPPWAYGFKDPASATPPPARGGGAGRGQAAPAPPDTSLKSLPGTTLQFTLTQIRDGFGPADWFPGDHPTMPDVVAHGHRPDVRACALCHYPNGKGRAENAPIAGLPLDYFLHTMADFRNGNRASADKRKANTNIMIAIAKGMTEEETKAAAEYFNSQKYTPWMKVVETTMVPKTHTSVGLFLPDEGTEKEPIADRIIEVPVDAEATETLRNPRSGFVIYAPPGSIKRGEALVMRTSAKTTQCGLCHGADLKGLGPVPGLAGRSPSYLVRQLYDMQEGTRKGSWTDLMKPVVAKLSTADMRDIVAYTASLNP